MDKDLQKYYEERFNMMATVGWKQLLEDIEGMVDAYNSLESVDSLERLHFRKGQLDILNWVLGLKATSEEAYKEMSDA